MTDNKQAVLALAGIAKRLGNGTEIKEASLEVNAGELIGICANKTEKNLFIKLLLGMKKPSYGKIFYWGKEMKDGIIPNHRKVGVFTEGMTFYPYMTGYRNLEAAAYSKDVYCKEKIKKAADMVGIGDIISKKARKYSKKDIYRLGIAAVLINEPLLIILDSPAEYLGEDGMNMLVSLLEDISSTQNCTVIVIEKNIANLLYCQKIARLDNGVLSELYSPEYMLDEYAREKSGYRIQLDNEIAAVRVIENSIDALSVRVVEKGIIWVELSSENVNDRLQKLIKSLVLAGIAVYTVRPYIPCSYFAE